MTLFNETLQTTVTIEAFFWFRTLTIFISVDSYSKMPFLILRIPIFCLFLPDSKEKYDSEYIIF